MILGLSNSYIFSPIGTRFFLHTATMSENWENLCLASDSDVSHSKAISRAPKFIWKSCCRSDSPESHICPEVFRPKLIFWDHPSWWFSWLNWGVEWDHRLYAGFHTVLYSRRNSSSPRHMPCWRHQRFGEPLKVMEKTVQISGNFLIEDWGIERSNAYRLFHFSSLVVMMSIDPSMIDMAWWVGLGFIFGFYFNPPSCFLLPVLRHSERGISQLFCTLCRSLLWVCVVRGQWITQINPSPNGETAWLARQVFDMSSNFSNFLVPSYICPRVPCGDRVGISDKVDIYRFFGKALSWGPPPPDFRLPPFAGSRDEISNYFPPRECHLKSSRKVAGREEINATHSDLLQDSSEFGILLRVGFYSSKAILARFEVFYVRFFQTGNEIEHDVSDERFFIPVRRRRWLCISVFRWTEVRSGTLTISLPILRIFDSCLRISILCVVGAQEKLANPGLPSQFDCSRASSYIRECQPIYTYKPRFSWSQIDILRRTTGAVDPSADCSNVLCLSSGFRRVL